MVKKVTRWQKGKISGSRVAVVRVNGKKYQIICEANKKWDKELEKKNKRERRNIRGLLESDTIR